MFDFFGIFKKKKSISKNDLTDDNGNLIQQSAIAYDNERRFLSLKNDDCAIVLHDDNNVEVIFTKSYDAENQSITMNEETLMAIALFMKQPGFLEMIVDEFRKIAKTRIGKLTDEQKGDESK